MASTCYVVCNWASGRRVFRTQMHVPGGYADVEVEAEAKIYLDNNYKGETLTTQEAAGSDKNFIFGGFAAKNREFIESLKTGEQLCSSPFRERSRRCGSARQFSHRRLRRQFRMHHISRRARSSV